jgi:hypothetical protein
VRAVLSAAVLVLAAVALAACELPEGVVTNDFTVPQQQAEDAARIAAGMSLAGVRVLASRLTTYGEARPGGTARPPDHPVWVVTLGGAFPDASCQPLTFSASARPCRSPAARKTMILDARNANLLEAIPQF